MRQSLCVVLCLSVISPFNAISQQTDLYSSDLQKLTAQLRACKALWLRADEKVKLLERNYAEALATQESFGQKIKDLEDSLSEALRQRENLQKTIDSLEPRLMKLSEQVKSLNAEIASAEARHVKDLQTLTARYDLRLAVCRTALIVLGLLAVAEGVYILATRLSP